MRYLFLILLGLIGDIGYSQNIFLELDRNQGRIDQVYLRNNLMLTQISSSGLLQEVLLFDTEEQLNLFLITRADVFKPKMNFKDNGVTLYVGGYEAVSYYGPHEHHSGRLKQLGRLVFTYFTDAEHHAGKIKEISGLRLNYFTEYEHNQGKLKQVGAFAISYFTPSDHHAGKFQQIGALSMDYYAPNEYHTGKIKQIGSIACTYFLPHELNAGQFKELKGSDSEVLIF